MAKLRQVQRPGEKANWTEFFYSGELKVVQNETETDNLDWINQLRFRGFEVIGEEQATPPEDVPMNPQLEETIHNDEPVVPLGTQTVDEDTEIPSEVQQDPVMPDGGVAETTEDAEGTSSEDAPPSRKRRKATKENE